MKGSTRATLYFSLTALIAIGVFFASPNRYPEPSRSTSQEQALVENLQHIYGRVQSIDPENQTITISYNTSYINRWRIRDLSFPSAQGEKVIIYTQDTSVVSFRSEEARYFPLNTFPYTDEEYQDVVQTLLKQDTIQEEKIEDLGIDRGITVLSTEKVFTKDQTIPASLIITRDPDYQNMEAIAVPIIYPILILLVSLGIGELLPKHKRIDTYARVGLGLVAVGWYLFTTFGIL